MNGGARSANRPHKPEKLFVLVFSTTAEIAVAVDDQVSGATLDPSVAKLLLQNLQSRLPREKLDIGLSDRELEILILLSEGLVKKQIAEKLSIRYATVDTHVRHIYEKLHVNNAPSAVGKAYKLGLFSNGRSNCR